MREEIDRLRIEVESYIISQEVAESENNSLHAMVEELSHKNEDLTLEVTKQQLKI
jgi:hypothetical protein